MFINEKLSMGVFISAIKSFNSIAYFVQLCTYFSLATLSSAHTLAGLHLPRALQQAHLAHILL